MSTNEKQSKAAPAKGKQRGGAKAAAPARSAEEAQAGSKGQRAEGRGRRHAASAQQLALSYCELTWYDIELFTLGAGMVALSAGASLTTALIRSIVTMLLLGARGWAANIFLLPAKQPAPNEKGTNLDASIGDEAGPAAPAPA